jgi:hypothetical protein
MSVRCTHVLASIVAAARLMSRRVPDELDTPTAGDKTALLHAFVARIRASVAPGVPPRSADRLPDQPTAQQAKGLLDKIADALVEFAKNPAKAIVDGLLRILGRGSMQPVATVDAPRHDEAWTVTTSCCSSPSA